MKKIYLIILLSFGIISSSMGTTRFWIGGGTANFTDGSHWSLTSGGSAIGGTITWDNTDIAIFNGSSGSPTVIFTAGDYIDKLKITEGITVTFMPNSTASRTLTVGHTSATDNLVVSAGSSFIISGLGSGYNRDMHVAMNSISGQTIVANITGTIKVTDGGTGYGEFSRQGSYATIYFNSGSTYEHSSANSGSDIPVATWAATSNCLIKGIIADMPGNLDQSFGNFTWNCIGQTGSFNLPQLGIVQGNFTLNSTGSGSIYLSASADVNLSIYGNYYQDGGNFYPAYTSGNDIIDIGGNFSLTGGFISSPGSGSCTINFSRAGVVQTYTYSTATYYQLVHFEVINSSILDMGGYSIDNTSSGHFNISSGCGLKTTHAQGIGATSSPTGCIRLTGTRTYNASANYTFYANGAQSTGNGLLSTLNGILTIGSLSNATTLTFTNTPTTINNKLILISNASANSSIASGSTVNYGSTGTLEYQGASAQTTTAREWPTSNPPYNVIINNPNGVALHDDRTIAGAFNLTTGAFSIGSHTLTLNGTLTKSSGSLTGGMASNIYVGGTGSSALDLPAVSLNNLTLNRASGLRLLGDVTINGTLNIINGSINLNGYHIYYGLSATLKYSGTSSQTTANAELPASGGPYNLYINNAVSVIFHADRTVKGTLTLNTGQFSIGSHTLTIKGIITRNSGSLLGGGTSNITFSDTTVSTNLPAITLANLTIHRSAGIGLSGDVTTGGILSLELGSLSIGATTLTINGTINQSGGSLAGGITSSMIFSGSAVNTGLPAVTLNNLDINRSAIINMLGQVTVEHNLALFSGNLSIGSNTFILNGGISGNSAVFVIGGYTSNFTVGGNGASITLPIIMGGLSNLIINRSSGVTLNIALRVKGDLTVSSGTLTVLQGVGLTVSGSTNISGNLLIRNQASLITYGTVAGTATIQRNIVPNLGWHLLSSPVSTQNICNGDFAPTVAAFPGDITNWDFYKWKPNCLPSPPEHWRNLRTAIGKINYNDFGYDPEQDGSPDFEVCEGYLVAYKLLFPAIHSFNGTPNTGNQTCSFPDVYNECSWDLAGNPFPSAIDWLQVPDRNTNLITDYYYIWNEKKLGGPGYEYWKDPLHKSSIYVNGNIPSMQGFFVKVDPNGPKTLGLPNSARAHDVGTDNWLKDDNANKLTIQLSNRTNYDEAFIMFENDNNPGGDPKDAEKMFSMNKEIPQVYTIVNNDLKAALNAMPYVTEGTAIPVGIVAPADGNYSITVSGMESFSSLTGLSLEDLNLNITQNLLQNPVYSFSAIGNEDAGRFLLHFSGPISINDKVNSNMSIYSAGKIVYITCTAGFKKAQVTISNLLGQEILTRNLNDQSMNRIMVNTIQGYYIVKVQDESSVSTSKVYINN